MQYWNDSPELLYLVILALDIFPHQRVSAMQSPLDIHS